MNHVRHYGLITTNGGWEIWYLKPKTFNDWTGCTMTPLHEGDFETTQGIQDLIDWINEIHRWGITAHARGCRNDVKSILLSEKNKRVSALGNDSGTDDSDTDVEGGLAVKIANP